ncbi:MAG: glycoside hydrolase family 2 TIM barrel-domain containing protein [Planctomycetota bacterium]
MKLFPVHEAALALVLAACPVFASEEARISLDGEWAFAPDPKDAGTAEEWFKEETPPEKFPKTMRVPAAWPMELKRSMREGVVWYRRDVTAPWATGRIFVCFEAACLQADIWLGGEYLGHHNGGYTAFAFDVTGRVKPGEAKKLLVRVDSTRRTHQAPTADVGWTVSGGLTRSVYLERRPVIRLEEPWIRFSGDETALAGTAVNDGSEDDALRLSVTVSKDGGKLREFSAGLPLKAGERKEISVPFDASGIPRWSLDHPRLVDVEIRTVSRAAEEPAVTRFRTGLRRLSWTERDFLMDGKRLWLQGFGLHLDRLGTGPVIPPGAAKEDVARAKDLGANFLRLGHYPFPHEWFDLCDEMGIGIWCEVPVWHLSAEELDDPGVREKWLYPQIDEMVRQYRRHPSVLIWSIGNENNFTSAYYADACKRVRGLDPGRPASFANSPWQQKEHWKEKDVNGLVTHFGWYHSASPYDIAGYLDAVLKQYRIPLLNIELCGKSRDSAPGAYASDIRFSPAFHEKSLRVLLSGYLARCDRVAGMTVWTLNDYHGDEEGDFGVFTRRRDPKYVLPTVRDLFTGEVRAVILDRTTWVDAGGTYRAEFVAARPEKKSDLSKILWRCRLRSGDEILNEAGGEKTLPDAGPADLGSLSFTFPPEKRGFMALVLEVLPAEEGGGRVLSRSTAYFDVGQGTPVAWGFVHARNSGGRRIPCVATAYGEESAGTAETPARVVFWPGKTKVTVRAEGFPPAEREMDVIPGSRQDISITFGSKPE